MKKLVSFVLGLMLTGCQVTQSALVTVTPDPDWPSPEAFSSLVVVQPKGGGNLSLLNLASGQTWRLLNVLPTDYEWENVFYNPWSPEGERLALIAHTSSAISLHLVDIKNQTVTLLYESKLMYRVQAIYWSHDGQRILFTEQADSKPYHDKLISFDIRTGETRLVYEQSARNDHRLPASSGVPVLQPMGWSYDDKHVGLVSNENQLFEIMLVDPDSGEVTVYPENDGMRRARWSANNGEILVEYASVNPLAMGLPLLLPVEKMLVINAESFEITRTVSGNDRFGILPAWTPDGDRVAYWKDLNLLCVVEVRGEEVHCPFSQLPAGAQAASFGDDAPPLSWDNRGEKLAFSIIEKSPSEKNIGYVVDESGQTLARSEDLYGFVYWPPSSR